MSNRKTPKPPRPKRVEDGKNVYALFDAYLARAPKKLLDEHKTLTRVRDKLFHEFPVMENDDAILVCQEFIETVKVLLQMEDRLNRIEERLDEQLDPT